MIASDLDGTLLYDVFTVSEENFRAIAEYASTGGLVVPTSGRCFHEILPELRECENIKYCISSNGAVITDLTTGEKDRVCISPALVLKIMELTSEYEVHHTIHHRDSGYIDAQKDTWERASYYNLNIYYYEHYHKWCHKCEDLDAFCKSGIEAEMISVFFRKQAELDECVKRLNALGGLVVTSSADFNIEIIAVGASKGDGVRRLAKKLGISKDEIIGVGDSRNDIALLEAAGLPLAVSNAADVLKEKAAKVICSNKEHIIKYILENIL